MTPAAGTTVADRFRLLRPLGQGGMGSVWLAQHIGLEVPCAIKFMHTQGVSEEVRLRFEREAKVAAQIRSPHVVQILDHGVWEGTPYIAMEYLEGEDLESRIQRLGRLDPRDTMAIAAQVARALSRAHAAGLVHRDLKPANIFLVHDDDREIAKVLDFGIAKDNTPRVGSTTKTGSLLGTPAYMSPEQAQGTKSIDHRSDLWSLAVVVYECLTGRLPFQSEAFGDLLLKIMIRPLPVPSEIAPVPVGFDAWWARAASRDPDSRFQSAKELSEALASALDLSLVDSIDSRTSVSGLFRASGERISVELGFAPRSQEVPVLGDMAPQSAAPSLGEAVTLIASDADDAERISVRAAGGGGSSAGPASTPAARQTQTGGALVSVVSPPTRRSGRVIGRVLAAAAVGAVVAVAAGFFLLNGASSGERSGPLVQPAPAEPAPDPAPAVARGIEIAPASSALERNAEPAVLDKGREASAPAPSSAPVASARAPSSTARASSGTARPPSISTTQGKPRVPPPAASQRRKPKQTDFGI